MIVCKRLGLGTVQWGLPYGINNANGIVDSKIVTSLLHRARQHGISVLDTAPGYGESEKILGHNSLEGFRIVTKIPSIEKDSISNVEVSQVVNNFEKSLITLNCKKIYGLLIHNVENLFIPGGEKLLRAMQLLKENGFVEKIGISIYDHLQIDKALKIFTPDLIQLPISVLDQRLLISGHLALLKNQGVEIHARSIFLQGLLQMPLDRVPIFFDPIRDLLSRWHSVAMEQQLTPNQAALAFVKNIPHIDKIIIGIDSSLHLESCINDFMLSNAFDASGLACNELRFINPSFWRLK